MESVFNTIGLFDTITLKEMDHVKLMNRTDTKFVFKLEFLPQILEEMVPFYKVLYIESKVMSRYETLYYDTSGLMLYKKHHNGELNRYKVRHRKYVDSDLGFLEVKFRNNKGRTIKERIKEKDPGLTFVDNAFTFLQEKLPFNPNALLPTVWVNYSRITLVNKLNTERVTIDLNLEFKRGEQQLKMNNLVIAEVKQEKRTRSPFTIALKNIRLQECSISKYCIAVAFMYHNVKKNNFKEKLISLKHIINYDHTPTILRGNN